MRTMRFVMGTLAVLAFLIVWALAQGIGTAIGHGMAEWLIR